MRLLLLYMWYFVIVLVLSWFGWWSLISAEITLTYKLGDLLNLWKEFNVTFSMVGGVGAIFSLLTGLYGKKDKDKLKEH